MDAFKDYSAEDAGASGGGGAPASKESAPPPPPAKKEEKEGAPQPEASSKAQPSQPSGACRDSFSHFIYICSAAAPFWRCRHAAGLSGAQVSVIDYPTCMRAGGRVIASPYARKLAREAGVDVADASGTGPGGRIVAADVQQLISSGAQMLPLARVGFRTAYNTRILAVVHPGSDLRPEDVCLPREQKVFRQTLHAEPRMRCMAANVRCDCCAADICDVAVLFCRAARGATAACATSLLPHLRCGPQSTCAPSTCWHVFSGGAPAKKAEAPKAETKGAPAAAASAPATSRTPGGYNDVPNSNIRKITAQRLLESKQKVESLIPCCGCNRSCKD